jgi:hypothetical protein
VRIRILTCALHDLRRGRRFYDRQQRGLGGYFYDSIFRDIDRLETDAGIHRKVFGYHRLLSKRFPFAIYYEMTEEHEATVFRVLDCRRNPAWIRAKLKE